MPINNPAPQPSNDRKYWMFALKIVGDFGASIAIPVVAFVLLGQWVDKRLESSPWATVAGFASAALISGKIIYTKAKQYGQQYQNLGEEKDKTIK